MIDFRNVNILVFDDLCAVYGTDAQQFEVGTLAYVVAEAVEAPPIMAREGGALMAPAPSAMPFFVLVDTNDAVDGVNTLSCIGGPTQPGCTNDVNIGTSKLRWRRLDTTFVASP